jgi:hypothetical protein
MLRHALLTGTCCWVRLSTAEVAKQMGMVVQSEQNGQAVGWKRKERSDKGKHHHKQVLDGEENDKQEPEDKDDNNNDNDEEPGPSLRK